MFIDNGSPNAVTASSNETPCCILPLSSTSLHRHNARRSPPETVALLGAMSGTPRLMAALINVETTMIYTDVVKEFRNPARSPLDIIHKRTGP